MTNEFHIAFYATALTIIFTVVFFTINQKRTDRLQNKIFLAMALIVIVNSITVTIAAIAEPGAKDSSTLFVVMEWCQFLYFLIHTALCPVLYYYVICVTGTIRKRSRLHNIIYGIPFLITEIFVLLNPFIHCIFYYDSDCVFHRNWAEALIYAAAAVYFVLAMFELMFSWNAVNARRRFALAYFFLLTLVGVVIQFVNINIKSELFAEALALMGTMLAVESEEDCLDVYIGVYNRRALQIDLHNYIMLGEKLPIIFVKLINADIVERVTGSANSDMMAKAGAEYFKTLVPRYHIYHPNSEAFVITCSGYSEERISSLVKSIEERFEHSWKINNVHVLLNVAVIATMIPDDLQSADDVFYVADSIIPTGLNIEGTYIDWIMRRADIERALRRSVLEEKFEVYYQPTYNMDGLSLHGAEALVRMNDDEVGFVSPEEFIPIAEQIGIIEHIDDYVLNEVCQFLKSGVPGENNMQCINVNLSVLQCIQPGFLEHIIGIVDNYNVEHGMINFEITESVGAEDYHTLSIVARKLKEEGFSLSMDDYGTGYSNVESMFELDFDIVKIDKGILWNAQKETNGRIILENSVRMIHDLGCKVLVEGVETREQVEMLKALNVDYLQGFYFSKAVPKKRFLRVIRANA